MAASPKVRINRGVDNASSDALVARAEAVGASAPNSPIYTGNSTCKAAIDEYVATAPAVVATNKKVANLEQQLVQARNDRDAAVKVCSDAYAAACSQVEKHSVTRSDVESCGFVALEVVKQGLVLPSSLSATYDRAAGAILIRVQYADKKSRKCIVEISPTPVGPATYVRLEGLGLKRSVPGYAPGTYEVRVATANARGRSDWFGPVPVIVR
jgi:hypothetical protein